MPQTDTSSGLTPVPPQTATSTRAADGADVSRGQSPGHVLTSQSTGTGSSASARGRRLIANAATEPSATIAAPT